MRSRKSTRVGSRNERLSQIRRMLPVLAAAGAGLGGVSAAMAASGTWSFQGNGSWGTGTNWVGASVPDGASAIADFSTLNITADLLVNLDTSHTVGQLKFGDVTTQSNSWT